MFADPVKNLNQFAIEEDMVVADLGAGTGFYTIAVAPMVPKGKVYAVEVIADFLTTIRNKLKDAHLSNVECILGNVEKINGTKLGSGIIDRVIASNVLFQIEDKSQFTDEIKRILKPAGKVLLIDWSDESPLGPKTEHVVTEKRAREIFEKKEFIFEREIDAGEHHYGIIFRKINE